VYAMAYKMGVKKTADYLASEKSGRILPGQPKPGSSATQFKPGQKTWNKGTRGLTGTHPNTRRTQFKPGRAPQEARNYRPIGSLRITVDGYLERKISDCRETYPARRWRGVHRLVWEEAHGPIPRGFVVCFKPGMHTTDPALITIDRLELLPLRENMLRNSLHQYPKEVAELMRLRGCLTRKINNRTKKERAP